MMNKIQLRKADVRKLRSMYPDRTSLKRFELDACKPSIGNPFQWIKVMGQNDIGEYNIPNIENYNELVVEGFDILKNEEINNMPTKLETVKNLERKRLEPRTAKDMKKEFFDKSTACTWLGQRENSKFSLDEKIAIWNSILNGESDFTLTFSELEERKKEVEKRKTIGKNSNSNVKANLEQSVRDDLERINRYQNQGIKYFHDNGNTRRIFLDEEMNPSHKSKEFIDEDLEGIIRDSETGEIVIDFSEVKRFNFHSWYHQGTPLQKKVARHLYHEQKFIVPEIISSPTADVNVYSRQFVVQNSTKPSEQVVQIMQSCRNGMKNQLMPIIHDGSVGGNEDTLESKRQEFYQSDYLQVTKYLNAVLGSIGSPFQKGGSWGLMGVLKLQALKTWHSKLDGDDDKSVEKYFEEFRDLPFAKTHLKPNLKFASSCHTLTLKETSAERMYEIVRQQAKIHDNLTTGTDKKFSKGLLKALWFVARIFENPNTHWSWKTDCIVDADYPKFELVDKKSYTTIYKEFQIWSNKTYAQSRYVMEKDKNGKETKKIENGNPIARTDSIYYYCNINTKGEGQASDIIMRDFISPRLNRWIKNGVIKAKSLHTNNTTVTDLYHLQDGKCALSGKFLGELQEVLDDITSINPAKKYQIHNNQLVYTDAVEDIAIDELMGDDTLLTV